MNDLGVSLLWCALQATIYLLSGAVLYAIVRRFGPASGASAAASTLIVLGCVSAAAFSPWPRWWTLSTTQGQGPADRLPVVAESDQTAAAAEAAPAERPASPKPAAPPAGAGWGDYWRAFHAEMQTARAGRSPSGAPRQWPTVVGALLVAGASLALARFALGLAALRRYRGGLQPVDDAAINGLAESLARRMGCRRTIELKQSVSLTTPATMGWRRPVIVLPGDWRTWTDQERRVVLAHEIAHVARGDYLAWLLSQVSVALHVYHPLAHWLAGRLRLEQELAADAWAAEMSGGRETYLFTLAQMALRQDDRRVAWAARPFLPGRGTLLRRIDMLSHTKPLRNVPLSRRRAAALAVVTVVFGLVVAGVRAPIGEATRAASAAPPLQAGAHAGGAISLQYVPPRAVAVLAIRPADLLSNADMQGLAKMLNETSPLAKAGLKIENIEEAKFIVTRLPDGSQPGRHAPIEQALLQVFRYKEPFDWKGKFGEHLLGNSVEASVAGKTYYHSDHGEQAVRPALYLPDDRTIVWGPEIDVQRTIISGGKNKLDWAATWEKVATGQAAAMVDLTAVSRAMADEPGAEKRILFAPIWEKGQQLFASLQARDGLSLFAQLLCATPDDAERVEATVQAVSTLARNALDEADRNMAKAPAAQAAALIPLIDLASEALKQGKLETKESTVLYATKLDVDAADTVAGVVTPAILSARQAAQRTQGANNLKQLMLALHNYQDVHGHFPPPVVLGPDGKTPHSWRVEILPFIEGQQLYQRYRMDEPWDSDNNKKVLEEMPLQFRDPAADGASQDTCYFALVGTTTALGPRDGKGTQIREITDGLSNTIALVAAKRAVPWTKPEDIDYDPSKPLPKLGGLHSGGFFAAFCDGSVRFLADNSADQRMLREMITKAGGEPILNR